MTKRKKKYRLEDLDCLLCFAMDMAGPNGDLPPIEVAEVEFEKAIREAKWREGDEDWERLVKGWDAEPQQRIYNTLD